jgi:hypothetical protein
MAHGLLWLPLLGIFIWLAWAGWNEYQKLEAYKLWAAKFDRAKYDIYAVLGQLGSELTWGIPTRQGPVQLETFSLQSVQTIRLLVNNQPADLQTPPTKGRAVLEFERSPANPVQVPFTEPALAAKWGQHLSNELNHQKKVGNRDEVTTPD